MNNPSNKTHLISLCGKLIEFLNKYNNISVSSSFPTIREEYFNLRQEIKKLCPDFHTFKKYIYHTHSFDYNSMDDIINEAKDLHDELFNEISK